MLYPRRTRAAPARLHESALSLLSLVCAALLVWGWRVREEVYVSAGFGLGYALGILGTASMLLLLVYSLRKRLGLMRSWGPSPRWFALHMVLGLVGPVAILFHANFRLGSLNSTVALGCVVLVAASGVVGRLIYPKIHHRLSGRRATLRELGEALDSRRDALGAALSSSPETSRELEELEAFALAGKRGVLAATWRFFGLRRRTRAIRRHALRLLLRGDRRSLDRASVEMLDAHLAAVRRVAEFGAYEQLFSLWHAFHLPLCILLFSAAVVHVIAVHMY
jgi:hypothetical protein